MEQLFLVEILVDSIYFASVDDVPQRKHVNIVATWANVTSLEIRNDGLGGADEGSKSAEMEFASGKSYLFSSTVARLLKSFTDYPLEVSVCRKDNPVPVGTALVNWQSDFVQMVDSCSDNFGYITPVSQRDVYTMKDQNGEKTGSVEVFVRLSCFGNSITTQFQVVKQKDPKDGMVKSHYYFKSPNAATTFQCQRYGLGTSMDHIPIGPTLNPTDFDDRILKTFYAEREPQPGSVMPSAFNLEQFMQQHVNRTVPDDQLSIVVRMDNKFYTLADLAGSGHDEANGPIVMADEELTVETINSMLCKDKDCPAAKLFKEFGIGPLATGRGLGTVYKNVDPPVTYGLSHANGTMERYGPYGVYRRPKRPSQDFVGKPARKPGAKSSSSSRSTVDSMRSECSCQRKVLRLRGGGPKDEKDRALRRIDPADESETGKEKKRTGKPRGISSGESSNSRPQESVLRLKGGAPMIETNTTLRQIYCNSEGFGRRTKKTTAKKPSGTDSSFSAEKKTSKRRRKKVLRLKGGALIEDKNSPSPLHACKSLMDNFDKLVTAYKRALGPCGQATCPLARNLVDESCGAFCPPGAPTPAEMVAALRAPDANSISSCGASTCPYARLVQHPVEPEVKLRRVVPACGDATCPYAKRRLGVADADADEAAAQMARLPKDCGAPRCPYRAQDEPLPPIHWDCPDPLPKDRCRNPDCPLRGAPAAGAPCGSPACPYAPPPPCGVPGCPFAAPTPCQIPGCPFAEIPPCTDPTCPINEEILKQDLEVCDDPRCPFYEPPRRGPERPATPAPADAAAAGAQKATSGGPCPCGARKPVVRTAKSAEAEPTEGETERVAMDLIEPCTPYTCQRTGGSLECAVCAAPAAPAPKARVTVADDDDDDVEEGPTEVIRIDKIEPCTPNSCLRTGGSLECLECAARRARAPKGGAGPRAAPGGDGDEAKGAPGRRRRRKRKSRYVLDSGDTYPGVKIGHRYCVTPPLNVPHNMGWLWNVKPVGRMKPRRGWKPGALTKTMLDVIEQHRAKVGVRPLIPPTPKPSKKKMRKNAYGVYESDSDVSVPPRPTLQIKKKAGCYLITMNPLKDPYALEENENPYMECTPLQFKISKNRPPVRICPGGEEDQFCCCDDDDDDGDGRSSNSELDIEFTPPAGIIHPERFRKKKNVVHQDTQYSADDIPKDKKDDDKKGVKKEKKGKNSKGKGKGKGKK